MVGDASLQGIRQTFVKHKLSAGHAAGHLMFRHLSSGADQPHSMITSLISCTYTKQPADTWPYSTSWGVSCFIETADVARTEPLHHHRILTLTKAHILTTSGLQNIIWSQLSFTQRNKVTRGCTSRCSSGLCGPLWWGSHAPMQFTWPLLWTWLPLYHPGLAHIGAMNVRPTAYRRRFQHAIGCAFLEQSQGCNPQVTGNGKEAARMQVLITPGSAIKCWYLKKSGHQPF